MYTLVPVKPTNKSFQWGSGAMDAFNSVVGQRIVLSTYIEPVFGTEFYSLSVWQQLLHNTQKSDVSC